MDAWRVRRPVVADLHHFDEEHDPDPHQSESSDPDPHQGEKSWIRISERGIQIRIRTIAVQICNIAYLLQSILS
jgi:hypothetical protein